LNQAFSERQEFDTISFTVRLQTVSLHSDTAFWRQVTVERKTISIMKACELVGVSRRTIYNWLSSGKIEYIRTAGGSVRIFVDTLWRDPNRAAGATTWNQEETTTQV
jgi:excisionase family DNA binding protein